MSVRTVYLWTLLRDERPLSGADPPSVAYHYTPGRGVKHGENLLQGFSGALQSDGCSGYNRLRRADRQGGALTLSSCWLHARRALKVVFDSGHKGPPGEPPS